jgi:hypothetical protein
LQLKGWRVREILQALLPFKWFTAILLTQTLFRFIPESYQIRAN